MSDHSISIVPKLSSYPYKEAKSKEILIWLVSKDIVKPTLSDCVLGYNKGYKVSEGAKLITIFPEDFRVDLVNNGLEIITNRQVFDTCQNGLDECFCPNCKENIAEEDWSFFTDWYEGKSNNIICPLCKIATDIHQFSFSPEWGFSDLGFKFWNWPELTVEFINEFTEKLKCDVSIVNQHI